MYIRYGKPANCINRLHSKMMMIMNTLVFLFIAAVFFLIRRRSSSKWGRNRFPPGPPGVPVFGNMFELGTTPHRTLTNLAQKFGPVLWLRLGVRNTMVIQSAKAAAELFKNHDLSFAGRTITETSRVFDSHKASMALAPYGPYWRMLRRLMTVDMLGSKRINETASIRAKCLDTLQLWIEEEASKLKEGQGVHVARFAFLMSFNLFGNLMVSRDLVNPNSKQGLEFFNAMTGLMEWQGIANMSDFFPWLKWLDPQGLKRKMTRDLGKAMEIVSNYVKDRIKEKEVGGDLRTRDFLDLLLEFEGNGIDEPAKLSDHSVNGFILELFLAGTETTSSTIEWALTELLCNPEEMVKAKAELTQVIGANRKVEESDIDKLPYLRGIIKETLRMHPPAPFLVPRKALEDTEFMGYFIPKDTQVFVNSYAIGRDPDVWVDEPNLFKPERFIGSKIDYKGQHHEFIPFGSGRRVCPGLPLAHRILHLTLGMLLHQFDWSLGGNVTRDNMDWKEKLGTAIRKADPLLAVPKKCLV